MKATIEQLRHISIFAPLKEAELAGLQCHAVVKSYLPGEVIMHEGDCLQSCLYALASGSVRITTKLPAVSALPMKSVYA